ncbi:CBS domain-containing protein [Rhizobium yanglingense]
MISRNAEITLPQQIISEIVRTRTDHEIGVMLDGEVGGRIGMITGRDLMDRALVDGLGGDARVRDVMTLGVKYCLDEDIDDVVRDMCEVQVFPLPSIDRNRRLTGVISIRRRRACRSGYRWRGKSGRSVTIAS